MRSDAGRTTSVSAAAVPFTSKKRRNGTIRILVQTAFRLLRADLGVDFIDVFGLFIPGKHLADAG